MLLVPTYTIQDPIRGTEIHAEKFIPAGTVTWRLSAIDAVLTYQDYQSLPETARQHIDQFGYWCFRNSRYVLPGDNAKHMKHQAMPNIVGVYDSPKEPFGIDIAMRDILPHERLTCNFAEFDGEWDRKGLVVVAPRAIVAA